MTGLALLITIAERPLLVMITVIIGAMLMAARS
jgi:hypothetical protein